MYTWRRARAAVTTLTLPYTRSSTMCVIIVYTWRARPRVRGHPRRVARGRPRAGSARVARAGREGA